MSHTNMILSRWRADEWPEYVEVSHEGVREASRRYVPERTCCIAEEVDEVETELGPIEVRTYLCGECHGRMAPDDAYCPNCGAKVVDE